MKFLILGNACTDRATMRYRGVSQASSNWLAGLMHGIEKAGGHAVALADVHDTLWPKGHLFPGQSVDLDHSVQQVLVRYGNIPGLRRLWLKRSIIKAARRQIQRDGLPDVLLTYNLYLYYVDAAKAICDEFNIPWIPIILDLDDPEADNWSTFNSLACNAEGCVFLSWWGYIHGPCDHKLHLDCGGEPVGKQIEILERSNHALKTIVYAGKMGDADGLKLLSDAIRIVHDKNVSFVICGKGKSESLEELAKSDSRVTLRGFVSDKDLDQICKKADIFINPRPSYSQENKMIFPSKISFYLSYGAPVISTWTPGLSPDYADVLIVPQQENAASLARSISSILMWSEEDFCAYKATVTKFLVNRSWENQGERLIEFVKTVLR